MVEMYVSGVSTRKVSQIVEELCGKSVSKSFVSSLTVQLDPLVSEWQNRSLSDTKYPFLMVDVVLYQSESRSSGPLKKLPYCHIAVGITEEGEREIIGFMIQNGESEETWTAFFDYLKTRGLSGTELVISDAHTGLLAAIRKSFAGLSWQRCQVHFMRNILETVPKKSQNIFEKH